MIQYINQYLTALADLTMEMAPYLLLGFFFAGILYVWFPKKKVYPHVRKTRSLQGRDIRTYKTFLKIYFDIL